MDEKAGDAVFVDLKNYVSALSLKAQWVSYFKKRGL